MRYKQVGLFLASTYFRMYGWVIFLSKLISCSIESVAMNEEFIDISLTANLAFLSVYSKEGL